MADCDSKVQKRYRRCPHCKEEVSNKRFKEHERLYYNKDSKEWTEKDQSSSADSGSELSDLGYLDCFHELEFPTKSDSTDDSDSSEMEDMEAWCMEDNEVEAEQEKSSEFSVVRNEDCEYWLENDEEIDRDITVSSIGPQTNFTTGTDKNQEKETHAIIKWIIVLVSYFQSRFTLTDAAVAWLFKFLHSLLRLLGTFSQQISAIADGVPQSLYQYKASKFHPLCDSFEKYCVCIKCNSLYSQNECTIISKCPYKPLRRSRVCGQTLMKQVVSASGNKRIYPHKIFCFSRLQSSLQKLLLRPGFIELCESTRSVSSSLLSDVYDGEIWKKFQVVDGKPFLSSKYNYGLLLNIDWLQPFEHTTYSVGVIFLVILNLPRSVRFKRENVILYGLIPGPAEPSLHLNTFISPLVSDLLDLWNGVQFEIPNSASRLTFRCGLLGVSCDLPAARKTCGFLSHSATLGCSRCYFKFFDGNRNADYGGDFEIDKWTLRTNAKHRADVNKISKCTTVTARSQAELKYGCRYSALLDLPYFDPVTMLMIDPMHNLFLGTAKHFMFNLLIRSDILGRTGIEKIKHRLSCAIVPPGQGRLPTSIDTTIFLTAEQWKNWTVYFSTYCLYGLIPEDLLECWRHFVLACCKLCQFNLTNDDLTIANTLLIRFCKRVKQLFGSDAITPNMHMHCHLVACFKDFGPARSFWLFPFERYNGILGNQPTNNRSVEVQLMRRFHVDNISNLVNITTKDDMFLEHFHSLIPDSNSSSTVMSNDVQLGTKYTLFHLSSDFTTILKKLYAKLHPEFAEDLLNDRINIPTLCRRYASITRNGRQIHSLMRRSAKNPYILANPVFNFTSSRPSEFQSAVIMRPAKLECFIEHSLNLSNTDMLVSHIFAVASWPMVHPKRNLLKPAEIWCSEIYEPNSDNTFLPVENILKRVIISNDNVAGEKVLIVIPLIE